MKSTAKWVEKKLVYTQILMQLSLKNVFKMTFTY